MKNDEKRLPGGAGDFRDILVLLCNVFFEHLIYTLNVKSQT